MREAMKFLGGSVAVYLIVAACSSSGGRHSSNDSDDSVERGGRTGTGGARPRGGASSGGASSGGASTGGESSGGMMGTAGEDQPGDDAGPRDSGILDGMIDPVPDAMADSGTGTTSGTRLKARHYVGEDGSRQPNAGWYDSQRQENCFFQTSTDGSLRCLPSGEASVTSSYFAEATCTAELVAISTASCSGTPRYATRFVAQTAPCNAYRYQIFEVGTEFVETTVYLRSGTSCTSTTRSTALRYFRLGAEIPPSSFVRATEELEQ